MDNQNIDLEAFAKKVAEDTAAKIAMKQAEQKAAEEAKAKAAQQAEEAKALEAESIKSVVNTGVADGVEKLMADVEAKMSEKDASLTEVMNSFRTELEEKQAEIRAMQESKKSFAGRSGSGDLTKFGKEFLQGRLLGALTRKGYDTQYTQDIMEKAGAVGDPDTFAGKLDQITSTSFVNEVSYAQRVAGLFPELQVSSGATVLPVTRTPQAASWGDGPDSDGTELTTASSAAHDEYRVENTVVNAYRLIAGTYVLNDTDEQLVVSLLPQLTAQLAKAHALAIDKAILFGTAGSNGNDLGLVGKNGALNLANGLSGSGGTAAATASGFATPEELAKIRAGMGHYGQNTNDLALIVPSDQYYDMIHQDGFTDVTDVGSDMATKLTGEVGSIFGVRVVVSDELPVNAASKPAGILVNTQNFVRPRLGGVNFETEYSVVNQRTNLVATQSVGFNRIIADAKSSRYIKYAAS